MDEQELRKRMSAATSALRKLGFTGELNEQVEKAREELLDQRGAIYLGPFDPDEALAMAVACAGAGMDPAASMRLAIRAARILREEGPIK